MTAAGESMYDASERPELDERLSVLLVESIANLTFLGSRDVVGAGLTLTRRIVSGLGGCWSDFEVLEFVGFGGFGGFGGCVDCVDCVGCRLVFLSEISFFGGAAAKISLSSTVPGTLATTFWDGQHTRGGE